MAKGKIIQELGKGLYKVEVDVNRTYIISAMERMNAKIVHIESQITIAEGELSDLQFAYSNIRDQGEYNIMLLKAQIETIKDQIIVDTRLLTTLNKELQVLRDELRALQSVPEPNPVLIAAKEAEIESKEVQIKEVENVVAEQEESIKDKEDEIKVEQDKIDAAKLKVTQKENQIATLKSELLSLQKRYSVLLRLGNIEDFETYAWCCDITEGLTGNVPLIEIAQEIKTPTTFLNIPPAYKDGDGLPNYTVPTYGEFSPFIALPVADALRNFMAMPAIQKWAPTYRYGTITAINYETNTCNVNVAFTTSSIQALGINQSGSLNNVPIEYMFCDAGAFEIGDVVTIQFLNHDWNDPLVIGFKEQPKPCGWEDPWDGPGYQWKYDWNYTWGTVYGTGYPATITANGQLHIEFDPTESGSGAYEQWHYLQFIPSNGVVTEKIKSMKFKATAMISCYETRPTQFTATVVGITEGKLITATLRVVNNYYWPHIGCIGYDYDETDWTSVSGINGSVWYYPGTYPYTNYTKNIKNDQDVYYEFPEPMDTVLAIGIEMRIFWQGGAAYNVPEYIPGGELYCDIIALA